MSDEALRLAYDYIAARLGESPWNGRAPTSEIDPRVADEAAGEAESLAAAIEDAAWRRAILRELTEIGMDMARDLRDRSAAGRGAWVGPLEAANDNGATVAPSVAPLPRGFDPAGGFAKLSRGIRLTVAQEAMTTDDLCKLRGRQIKAAQAAAVRAEKTRAARIETDNLAAHNAEVAMHLAARSKVEAVMDHAIDTEILDREDAFDYSFAYEERLDHDTFYQNLHLRPLAEVVEALCRDIALPPNPDRVLDGVPTEDPSAGSRAVWDPFNWPSPRRIYPDGIDRPPVPPPDPDDLD